MLMKQSFRTLILFTIVASNPQINSTLSHKSERYLESSFATEYLKHKVLGFAS